MSIMKLFKNTLFRNISVLIFSSIVTTLIGLLIEIPAGIYLGFFVLLIVLFVLCVIASLMFTRRDIDDQMKQVNIISLWMTEQHENNEGYVRSRDVVLSAKKSILVISHHVPEGAEIEFSETRSSYLIEGIEHILKTRLQQPDAPSITYRRIIQSDRANEDRNILRRSSISSDYQTFNHCSRVYGMLDKNLYNNLYVDFRLSEPIPSFPNTLIVDDKYMLFALSTRAPRLAVKTDIDKYINVGVFLIEDRSGKTIQSFISAFERFFENSQPINEIIDD